MSNVVENEKPSPQGGKPLTGLHLNIMCLNALTMQLVEMKRFCGGKRMITIFNRKELLITMDMSRQLNVRDILSANGIDYTIKVTNLQSASAVGNMRGRFGSFGINQDYSYEYKIYVHKQDYDYALKLIS